jgi:hypothetical protein
MTSTIPIADMTRFLADPEGAAIQRPDAEPIEYPVLADAEEEELAELWARDAGNQGA